MINLDGHKKSLDAENGKISRLESKDLKELEIQKERIIKKYDAQRSSATEEYCKRLGIELYNDLQGAYNILQTRSELGNATPEEVKRITAFYEALNATEDANAKKAIEILAENLSENQRAILSALKTGGSLTFTPAEINSYISQDGEMCHIVAPIDGESNRFLTKNLERKLGAILAECRILTGHSYNSEKGVVNEKTREEEINFEPDQELKNGFLIYSLSDIRGGNSQLLTGSLTKKIIALQPDGFKEAKLKHIIQELPFEIINYFRTQDLSNSPLQNIVLEEGKEISEEIQREGKRNYGLSFHSENIDERKQEAISRLEKLGENISVNEAKEVLGLNQGSAASRILSKFKTKRYVKGYKNKKEVKISKDELKEFIQTHRPAKTRWDSF